MTGIGAEVVHGRRLQLLETMAAEPTGPETLRLCTAITRLVGAAGAGLSVAVDRHTVEPGAATPRGAELAALEFALGEGPATSAHRDGILVELSDTSRDASWPAFSAAAATLGIGSVVAIPLRRGSVRLGALTLGWSDAAAHTDEELALALTAARLGVDLVLADQQPSTSGELDLLLADGPAHTAPIHQASGMVAAQLGVSVGTALVLLRARAFADGCTLTQLATDVIAHRIRLSDDP